MRSDFAAVRHHLEKAQTYLRGSDQDSRKMNEAIEILVEAALAAEYRAPKGEVIAFPLKRSSPR
ncbi:hypothetical protein G6N74_20585 [Mesorhizobium sp. CGMCC 1.15528]|uniref:Uncharacterized protein n=1 Tax=Mesorhizobium zhangyense TaxID=1776730 RepID=A0A7C9VF71_9HYPH|nr:hypothetical protein [Mesorhizobium zhangyense]RJG47266.1 hypothetical protein D3Y55_15840 [Mesorhizobium sp. DCY119]